MLQTVPAIFFSKESSQAYILISLILLRISLVVRTRLSVIIIPFHLNLLMSLARKPCRKEKKSVNLLQKNAGCFNFGYID